MLRVFKSVFFAKAIAVLGVLAAFGVANAVTEVTNVQPNVTSQNGGTEIVIDASVVCENVDDVVLFEAMQTQGRNIATGVLEVKCTAVETVNGPFTILVFEGQKFRSGPFTLWAKSYDSAGAFVKGQGFQLKGKK